MYNSTQDMPTGTAAAQIVRVHCKSACREASASTTFARMVLSHKQRFAREGMSGTRQ